MNKNGGCYQPLFLSFIDVNGEDITEGIGILNLFRYRGYYYDPELGRFISQDSINYANHETINGLKF